MQSDSVFDLESKFDNSKSKKKKSNKINKEKENSLLNEKYQPKMNRVESKEFIAENGVINNEIENTLDLPNSLARTENTVEKDKKLIAISDTKSKQSGVSSTTNRSRNIKSNKSDLFSVTIKSLSNSGQLYQVNASGADITKITDIVTTG